MAIVIDINVFAPVFDKENAHHKDFFPVKAWLEDGRGYLLFGGTKYLMELTASYRHLRLVRQLHDAGIAIKISTAIVDKLEGEIKEATAGTKCNDQHIIALLSAAHCSLLCSVDTSSFEYVKNKSLYPKGSPTVRIYSSARNVGLLQKCKREDIRNSTK